MYTCHIYAFILKGCGEGYLFTLGKNFFEVLFPLFLSGFRNKLQFLYGYF